MEGSTIEQPLRLRRHLLETGTSGAWLARRLGVARTTVNDWLHGRESVSAARREQILVVLRERQSLPITSDLFEREDDVESER